VNELYTETLLASFRFRVYIDYGASLYGAEFVTVSNRQTNSLAHRHTTLSFVQVNCQSKTVYYKKLLIIDLDSY